MTRKTTKKDESQRLMAGIMKGLVLQVLVVIVSPNVLLCCLSVIDFKFTFINDHIPVPHFQAIQTSLRK